MLQILDPVVALDFDICAEMRLIRFDQEARQTRDLFEHKQQEIRDRNQAVRLSYAFNDPKGLGEMLEREAAADEARNGETEKPANDDYPIHAIADDALEQAEYYDKTGERVTPQDGEIYFTKDDQAVRVIIMPAHTLSGRRAVEHW